MKQLLAIVFLGTFLSGVVMAQDPEKDFKNAEKSLEKFIEDGTKIDALKEGEMLMKSAFNSMVCSEDADKWIKKGEIYNELANAESKRKTLDPSYQISAEDAALKALEAFKTAASLTDKKNDLRDVEQGIQEVELHLNNYAVFAFQAQDYKTAFDNASASIDAYKILKNMGANSRLESEGSEDLLYDQYRFAAISGYYSQQLEASKPFFDKLYEQKAEEAFIYEALFNIYKESDEAKAAEFLSEGRELFPEDTGLLFAEINLYLQKGELDELISKLELALEKEPDNVSIYTTLGSVYDQLHVQARETGDTAKARMYFDKAEKYYRDVLEKDPDNFDATYSLGALYYNKAASYVDRLNDLAADLTPAGMKNYDATKAEMDALFNEALPFFIKAEQLNSGDMNTLIALKEIYARLNELEKSTEYKTKMEKLSSQ